MSAGPARRRFEGGIAPDARALRRRLHGGGDPAASADAGESRRGDDGTGRRELYVLLAVTLDEVIGDFLTEVPPEAVPRLPVAADGDETWATAAFCDLLLETFGAFFDRWGGMWRGSNGDSWLTPLLERIDALGPGTSAVLDLPCPGYAEQLMRAGMTTMAAVAPPVLSAAVHLAPATDGDAVDSVADLARASIGIPARLAALTLDDFNALQHELIDPETMEFRRGDTVRLVEPAGRRRLALAPGLTVPASAPSGGRPQPIGDRRIGCPTLVRVERTPAMERLWAWTVEAAATSGYFAARLNQGDVP